jgi:hypothetical protein
MSGVETAYGPHGEVLHSLAWLPDRLPPVTKRDMERAWDAARAESTVAAPLRGFRFARPEGAPVELYLNDPDASAWAGAVDRAADLSTTHGVSLCLRLLALVDAMGRLDWLRGWFSFAPGGAEIKPALLQAAALAPLNEAGGFDETALRALLPAAARGDD